MCVSACVCLFNLWLSVHVCMHVYGCVFMVVLCAAGVRYVCKGVYMWHMYLCV